MLFCVTEDRRFAYQSRQGVTAEDAVRYLLEDDVDDVDQNISYDIVGEFQKEVTKNIYTNADFVRSLKLKNIGLRSDSSVNNGIVDSLDNASGNTDTIEISTGNGENDDDLSLVEAIDGLARLSDIDRIRTRTEDGKIEEVGLNGRYTYTHSKDVTDENQAQNLRDAIDYVYSDLL